MAADFFTDKRAVSRLKRKISDNSFSDAAIKELLEEALDTVIDYTNNPDPPLSARSAVADIAYLKYMQMKAEHAADEAGLKSYSYSEGDVSESAAYATADEVSEKINGQITARLASINHLRVVSYGIPKKDT